MFLKCKVAFGNFKPGDEVEVPDGGEFDTVYFEQIKAPVKKDKADAS